MDTQFDEVMSKRTDADLVKILTGPPDDYQPAALDAAKKEYDRRNLSDEQIISAKQEIAEQRQLEENNADEPLSIGWKIFAFALPGLLQVMFAGTFKADGYNRKAKELLRWTLYGLGFYAGFIVLIAVLSQFV